MAGAMAAYDALQGEQAYGARCVLNALFEQLPDEPRVMSDILRERGAL
jgi:hypothetical protein